MLFICCFVHLLLLHPLTVASVALTSSGEVSVLQHLFVVGGGGKSCRFKFDQAFNKEVKINENRYIVTSFI